MGIFCRNQAGLVDRLAAATDVGTPKRQGRLKVIEWRTRGHASKSEHPFDVVRQFLLTFVH